MSGDAGGRSSGSANTVFLFLCLLRLSGEKLGPPPSAFSSALHRRCSAISVCHLPSLNPLKRKDLERLDLFLWKRKDLERLDLQGKRQQHTDADTVGNVGLCGCLGFFATLGMFAVVNDKATGRMNQRIRLEWRLDSLGKEKRRLC
ncbi:hypothetical protein F2Q70_00004453 [Brassica cretica]|uniref:Uncharacterized protein n=1 Tax=Brassica cretica TaxID=69181 RepID=A0A3N6PNM2_BRACR|nr:hypothetical protein F2Q70_00004453 [Brassica cretica]KAF3561757.1 hypothetical protein DY000_02016480 [Brassica cretica]